MMNLTQGNIKKPSDSAETKARSAPASRKPRALTLEEKVIRSCALQSGLCFVAAPVHFQSLFKGAEDHFLLGKKKAKLLRDKLCLVLNHKAV